MSKKKDTNGKAKSNEATPRLGFWNKVLINALIIVIGIAYIIIAGFNADSCINPYATKVSAFILAYLSFQVIITFLPIKLKEIELEQSPLKIKLDIDFFFAILPKNIFGLLISGVLAGLAILFGYTEYSPFKKVSHPPRVQAFKIIDQNTKVENAIGENGEITIELNAVIDIDVIHTGEANSVHCTWNNGDRTFLDEGRDCKTTYTATKLGVDVINLNIGSLCSSEKDNSIITVHINQ